MALAASWVSSSEPVNVTGFKFFSNSYIFGYSTEFFTGAAKVVVTGTESAATIALAVIT